MRRSPVFLMTVLAFGFAFLYVPILSMIVYSFNASRLATVWGGFSTKWYLALWKNPQIVDAALLSLKIALVSATFATILGTLSGIALARFRSFRGRTLYSGLVTAPLIMPEVITGISSLIFFILIYNAIGWPVRGFTTITLAHITFSMVFVSTVVYARLIEADRAIEEAAMDLGSRPWQVLKDVTLPVCFPAIMSGWLLAFTISLDDVVITSFTTGPGATTLPLVVWSKVRLGVTPDINALATLIVVIVGIGVIVAGRLMWRAERRRERDMQLAYQANTL
ncbi:MAG: ABC transporter permease subunit [Paracoccaceae bacterium]